MPAAFVLAAAMAAGCAGPKADNGQTGSPAGHSGGTAGSGGVSGSQSGPSCDELDCVAEITARLEIELGEIEEPRVSIVDSRCEEAIQAGDSDRTISGPLCICSTSDDSEYYVGSAPDGCAVRGHTHECLMEHGEYGPCRESEPEQCEAVCDQLQERLEADTMATRAFTVRSARCVQGGFEGSTFGQCDDAIVEVEGFCYPTISLSVDWRHWQSCELDDDHIRESPAPALPDCDEIDESVPSTADCVQVCEEAADCDYAYGCGSLPSYIDSRGRCGVCGDVAQCASGEVCAHEFCVLEGRAECDLDEDCPGELRCTPQGVSNEGRGNEEAAVRCMPP